MGSEILSAAPALLLDGCSHSLGMTGPSSSQVANVTGPNGQRLVAAAGFILSSSASIYLAMLSHVAVRLGAPL